MKGTLIRLFIFVLIAIPFTTINFSAFEKGDDPTIFQMLGSLIFILIWVGFSYLHGRKEDASFLIHGLTFWGIGLILMIPIYLFEITIFHIIYLFIYPGPLYGINFFLKIPADYVFVLFCLVFSTGITFLAYWIGKVLNKTSSK